VTPGQTPNHDARTTDAGLRIVGNGGTAHYGDGGRPPPEQSRHEADVMRTDRRKALTGA
jgi:hypothetical protein